MRTRHRIPTIFNLSMVDVLCCALGCVILLWLLNFRDAKRRAAAAGQSSVLLADARVKLDDFERQARANDALLRSLHADRDSAYLQVAALERERNQTAAELDQARRRLIELGKEVTALKTQNAAADDLLAKKTLEQRELTKKLQASEQRLLALEKLARENEARATAAARMADDLAGRLRLADELARKFRLLADDLPGLRSEAKDSKARLSLAEERLAQLERDLSVRQRDLADARRRIDELQLERQSLADVANRLRAAADNRFAGISLTGQRVIFLIDVSGSMRYVDEKTPAPDKWTGVRETVARILRSLPDLEQFQVILFESKPSFPLGGEGRWHDFDPKTSIDKVAQALAAITPKGSTNMYLAFESAFAYRPLGLDTIYLLSDGLPNVGPGLPADSHNLKEIEKAEALGKHVRRMLQTDWNRAVAGRARVRIHAIGFYYESPDLGAFLWALARENDGSFVGMSKP